MVMDLHQGIPIGRVSRVSLDNEKYEAVVEMYVDLGITALANESIAMILTDPITKRPFIGVRNRGQVLFKSGEMLRSTMSAADDLAPQIEHWVSQRERARSTATSR
jgi:hypothetical protein